MPAIKHALNRKQEEVTSFITLNSSKIYNTISKQVANPTANPIMLTNKKSLFLSIPRIANFRYIVSISKHQGKICRITVN
ncbi:hypothetical protein [Flavihumibacter sp. UBA7668]|uniref:hypothetical protein n=1 Tax=Flavihumibacter sp. UBA7668 TaxID=1946542 RepID=UPI0025BB1B84|nr:hypothetical protein [Flavihumibacter sp. UBA7668]